MNIHLKIGEHPEDLYQRIMAFIEDSLLSTTSVLSHHWEILAAAEDEELTPTLENLVVLLWLYLVHKDLPSLVKQKYGTVLRSQTLAFIKPEISQAMDTLLETLQSTEEAEIMRTGAFPPRQPFKSPSNFKPNQQINRHPTCPLCQAWGRSTSHYLSKCPYLPDSDRKFLARARAIITLNQSDQEFEDIDTELSHQASALSISTPLTTQRVQINKPPTIDMDHKHHTITLTLDSGAEANMIKESSARRIEAHITASTQNDIQTDGKTSLHVKGEIKLKLTRGNLSFVLEALVVEDIDSEVLAGVPFMISNDISLRPAKSKVCFIDDSTYTYQSTIPMNTSNSIRRVTTHLLRAPDATIWPGEYIELDVPPELSDSDIALGNLV